MKNYGKKSQQTTADFVLKNGMMCVNEYFKWVDKTSFSKISGQDYINNKFSDKTSFSKSTNSKRLYK